MRLAILLAALVATLTATAAAERDGNRISILTTDGGVAIEFATPVSFQYERWWGPKQPVRGAPLSLDNQTIALVEKPDGSVELTTRFLVLTIVKGALIVKTTSGREVAMMPQPMNRSGFNLKAYPEEKFFGLGATNAASLNLRGLVIPSTKALLISSQGYGLHTPSGGATFDLAKADPDAVAINQTTFQFYYGPNPKEILEQHVLTTHNQIDFEEATLSVRDAKKLPNQVLRLDINESNYCDSPRLLNQLSLSGELFPAVDLAKLGRYAQLVRLLPFLYDSKGASHPDIEQLRSPWDLYLIAYLREAHDRGLPFIRPLLMQFPQDKNERFDAYMIGDEVLVAPGCNVTEVELPRGAWTDLRTNLRHPGRQKIANDPKAGLPIYAKAGSLIPLTGKQRLELHYFPSLGGEFFVYEPSVNEYSQFHAAPSADFMRVESESKVARTCEWILHHTPKPKSVGETGKMYRETTTLQPGTWFHNSATGNLHIVVATGAGEDHIVNMSF